MQELAQKNSNHQLKIKSKNSYQSTQIPKLYLTLPQLSTFNEKDLKKYWNSQSEDIQSRLWLPTETDLRGQDLDSFNGLSNYLEGELSHLMRVLRPKVLTRKSLLVSLPASATPTMESEVLGTKKIRIYPYDEGKFFEALNLYRRAYNLTVALYTNDGWKDEDGKMLNLRPQVKEICKSECDGRIYNSIIVDNAVLKAKETFLKVIKANKKNKTNNQISFKSRKLQKQTFAVDRLTKSKLVAPLAIGKFDSSEVIPDESIGRSCSVTHERGRWYIQTLATIKTKAEIQGDVKTVAIDPGVRTFATCYSQDEVVVAGEDFARTRLLPLALKVKKLISRRDKIKNIETEDQWKKDRLREIEKKIWKLQNKKDDLVSDLHDRLAFDLVQENDLIFLPTFETKKMSSRKGRKINRTTVKSMLDLSHYKFKMRLKWYAKKYGKIVVDCNESYTSKTRSWDGTIDEKLGSKKYIKDDKIKVGRDINAARGILIKQLNQAA